MSTNAILANVINKNERSTSNSPRYRKHLTGDFSKCSPSSSDRKLKPSSLANYCQLTPVSNPDSGSAANKENSITPKLKKRIFADSYITSPNNQIVRLGDSPLPKIAKKCGLCGSLVKKLKITECCGNYVCDDAYIDLFASCRRSHDRYTKCAFHFVNDHVGKWQECEDCVIESALILKDAFNFETNENAKTYTCKNCKFSAESVKAFIGNSKNGLYCMKKECREASRAGKKITANL
jgi:hypothetical protein